MYSEGRIICAKDVKLSLIIVRSKSHEAWPHHQKSRKHLVAADDDAVAAGGALAVVILRLRRAVRAIRVSAAGATTVELDAVASAGDAVAFAGAARGSDGAWAGRSRAAGAARAEGRDVGISIGVRVAVVGGVGDLLGSELLGELFEGGWVRELLGADAASLCGLGWLWALDLGAVEWAALGDTTVGGDAAGSASLLGGAGGGGLSSLASWNIEGVQLAAGGWLSDGLAGWVVRDVVTVDDVVVPVALALLESGSLEAEGALPAASLGGVLGQWELAIVVVPGTEQVDGLDGGGGAEREVELDSGHYVDFVLNWFLENFVRKVVLSKQETDY